MAGGRNAETGFKINGWLVNISEAIRKEGY